MTNRPRQIAATFTALSRRSHFDFRLAKPVEVEFLKQLLAKREAAIAAGPKAAQQLVSGVKGWKMPAGVEAGDLAKWFTVANVLLNLDEAITKG